MGRNFNAHEIEKRAKAKRAAAMERVELGFPTVPRRAASGATSMAVKAEDPALRRLIDDYLKRLDKARKIW